MLSSGTSRYYVVSKETNSSMLYHSYLQYHQSKYFLLKNKAAIQFISLKYLKYCKRGVASHMQLSFERILSVHMMYGRNSLPSLVTCRIGH